MNPETLRSRRERELGAKLLADPLVMRAVREAGQHPEAGVRRKLLSTAVRVLPGMSAQVDRVLEACARALGLTAAVELYVYPEPHFNAACAPPEAGRVLVMVSSGLLEAFDGPELAFVLGHELGHHVFTHHQIPIGALLHTSATPSGPLALELFAWSRYAEVSADRAGLWCAKDLDAATRCLFKLASGLRGGVLQVKAEALLGQVGDIRDELAREQREVKVRRGDDQVRAEWFTTHPFSPLRLHAAHAFTRSALYGSAGGLSDDALEGEVQGFMSLMEPTYLEEKSEEAELMRRLLLAGGLLVANAEGDITDTELEALERFFGKGSTANLSLEALRRDLDRRVRELKERVPPLRRSQVVRDLCVVALADGHAGPEERSLLASIAEGALVPAQVVEQALAQPASLD